MNFRPRYDWRPDLPDHRDHTYSLRAPKLLNAVDLSAKLPVVFDQSTLGSCTGNAMSTAFAAAHPGFIGSRLMIYYNARQMEGTVDYDAGAQIRDVVKGMNKIGTASEQNWKYLISRFRQRPTAKCYAEALMHRVTNYQRLLTLDDMLNCLSLGKPFIFGFTVYSAFESTAVAQTGTLSMPKPTERVLGGHAVTAYGYDLRTQRLKVRNSWGPNWGNRGNFTMPFEYLTNRNLSDDFWVINA